LSRIRCVCVPLHPLPGPLACFLPKPAPKVGRTRLATHPSSPLTKPILVAYLSAWNSIVLILCGSSLVRLPTLALLSRSRLLRLHIPLTIEGSASKVSIHFYTSRPGVGPSTSLIFRILLFGRFDGFFPLHLPFLSRYGPHSRPSIAHKQWVDAVFGIAVEDFLVFWIRHASGP
jgi:hypothetical protein